MVKKAFKIFLSGEYEDYLEFVKDQPQEKRLEWKQFQEIRELGSKVVNELDEQVKFVRLILWETSKFVIELLMHIKFVKVDN